MLTSLDTKTVRLQLARDNEASREEISAWEVDQVEKQSWYCQRVRTREANPKEFLEVILKSRPTTPIDRAVLRKQLVVRAGLMLEHRDRRDRYKVVSAELLRAAPFDQERPVFGASS